MLSFSELIQQGTAHAWLFIPSAILLGALHGLEPGHSKTMMAAFIVAIRGSIGQAVLLGITATISHTFIVWTIGLGGMYLWRGVDAEKLEPYFQFASGIIIMAIAAWMFWRTWREQASQPVKAHDHHTDHEHPHQHAHSAAHVEVTHQHDVSLDDSHQHHHRHEERRGLDVSTSDVQDAHQLAHAADIRHRFADRNVTNWQIAMFGLTGGLVPCPAAITVLLLCLQLKEFTLGAALVLCFSIGLAITLVSVGALTAFSLRHATRRFSGLANMAKRAPYLSSVLMIAVGIYVGVTGWLGMP